MKIRINDLARELEVKSKAVLDVLPVVGILEKKTHSGSLSDKEADGVRRYFRLRDQEKVSAARTHLPQSKEMKTKIDLSHISRPGDVLRALLKEQQRPSLVSDLPVNLPKAWKPVPGQPIYRRRSPAVPKKDSSIAPRTQAPQREPSRLILPQTSLRPVYTVKGNSNGVKLETSGSPRSQERSPHQETIKQAEEALKVLRTQEKQSKSSGTLKR